MNDDPKISPPEEFLNRMNNMLGDDFQVFLNSYQQPRTFVKASVICQDFLKNLKKIVPFPISPIPWIPGGHFVLTTVRPMYASIRPGLYIFQEPSAMTPVSRLLPRKSPLANTLLDMCAPGGKATALGAPLKRLWASWWPMTSVLPGHGHCSVILNFRHPKQLCYQHKAPQRSGSLAFPEFFP